MAQTIQDFNRTSEERIYENGFVCFLENIITQENFFVGSTDNIRVRFNSHKSKSFNINCSEYNTKKSIYIRDIGRNNFSKNIIESFTNISKSNLKEKDEWIKKINRISNSNNAILNVEQRYQNQLQANRNDYTINKLKHNQMKKKIYERNKDYILEKQKKYYEDTKEDKKEYYQANKDKIT